MEAFVNAFVFPAALALLPPAMDTPKARAQLLAIGLQESGFTKRRQVTKNPAFSPARGFWQNELTGMVAEVLSNPRSKPLILPILSTLRYPPAASAVWEALEHNDVLACAVARVGLWLSPLALPSADEADHGWHVYESTWKPGAPHPDKWPANFARAWRLVTPT